LYPSVWRDEGCEAHFILSRGRLWISSNDGIQWGTSAPDERLIANVMVVLSSSWSHYFELAVAVDAEPWEALRACEELVRRGKAVELRGRERGQFRAVRE
jgi:hypothetical protein